MTNNFGVLVVDDDEPAINLIKLLLRKNKNYKLFNASNGIECLSILAERGEEIYVIIMDIKMPDMDGFEVISHISQFHRHHVAILLHTAYDEFIFKAANQDLSPFIDKSGYLMKPINSNALVEKVKAAVDRITIKREHHTDILNSKIIHKLDHIVGTSNENQNLLKTLVKSERGFKKFLSDIGYDVLKTLIIALFVIAFLYFGFSSYIKSLLDL